MSASSSLAPSLLQTGSSLLWLPQAALLAWSVDGMLQGRDWRATLVPAVGIVLIGCVRAWSDAWATRALYQAARNRLTALRTQAALALAACSPLDRHRTPSGQAASVMSEQSEAVLPYLVRYQPARWKTVCVPLAILLAVLPWSWLAALLLLVAAPLIPLFMALVGLGARQASRAQMVEMGGMNAFLLDRLRGLASLRALGAVDLTANRLDHVSQSLRQRTMAVLRIAFLSSAVLELFSALGVAMVAAFIGFSLLGTLKIGTWGQSLTLGPSMFILLLAPAFFEPLRELASVWHDKAAGQAGLAELEALNASSKSVRLLADTHAAHTTPTATALASISAPTVDVTKLYFSYPGEQPVFDGFTLEVQSGEHIAITGASGAGKSTLLALLAGLVPAGGGDIRIAGVTLNDANVEGLRQRMAWIGQKPHVFSASVAHNISLGRESVSQSEINAALDLAELGLVAQARPHIVLSEGGHGLSGGEAVRLALARAALAPHADLLLVDEPTAHLDPETATRVTDALLRLARGKTMLVATHDPVLVARLQRRVHLGSVVQNETVVGDA